MIIMFTFSKCVGKMQFSALIIIYLNLSSCLMKSDSFCSEGYFKHLKYDYFFTVANATSYALSYWSKTVYRPMPMKGCGYSKLELSESSLFQLQVRITVHRVIISRRFI